MGKQGADGALDDLQVIDLSRDVAGAFCTRLLAGLGARVIKIEPPGGDPLRWRGPFPDGGANPEASGLFQHLNTDKQSVALDVTSASDVVTVRRLLARADVLVESFPPGSMEGWELGYELVHKTLPHLVYTSVTPFGQRGPYRDYQADSAAVQALCSYAYTSGDPDREPLVTACDLAEYFAGAHAFTATLAALANREVTQRGSYVDVSMLESLAMADDYNYACYIAMGAIRKRYYSQVMTLYPNEILPCKDGYVFAVGGSGGFPLGMALLIERPELADHVLFKSARERALRWRELNEFLLPWFREHAAAEIVARAQELRMPFARVATAAGLLADGHLQERRYFQEVQPPEGPPLRLPGTPFKLGEIPRNMDAAPRLGEHTNVVSSESSAVGGVDGRPSIVNHGDRAVLSGMPTSHAGTRSPLRGLRVIDLSHVWAGPAACRIMADLGAEVIKVERAAKPDSARTGYIADQDYRADFWNRALYFHRSNAGKRSLTLDLSAPAGASAFRELLATADVLVENYSPRAMRALGFSYATVRQIRPDIVMLSISAYGQTGPYADYAGFGTGLEPASGIADASGYPGGGPYKNGNTYVDPFAGVLAVGAILAALRYRARTGKGQYFDQSLQETAVQIAGESLVAYQLTGRPLPRTGARSTQTAPQGMYPCAGDDEWLYLSVRTEGEWRQFCDVLGHRDWLENERFCDAPTRLRHHDELDGLIVAWTSGREKTVAMHELQRNGILAAAVLNAKEVLLDPQLAARGFFEPVRIHEAGLRPVQRYLAATFSDIESRARGPAPKLGANNHDVLRELVGLSDAELGGLASAGVIGTEPALAGSRESFERALRIPLTRYVEQGALAAVDDDYRATIRTVLHAASGTL